MRNKWIGRIGRQSPITSIFRPEFQPRPLVHSLNTLALHDFTITHAVPPTHRIIYRSVNLNNSWPILQSQCNYSKNVNASSDSFGSFLWKRPRLPPFSYPLKPHFKGTCRWNSTQMKPDIEFIPLNNFNFDEAAQTRLGTWVSIATLATTTTTKAEINVYLNVTFIMNDKHSSRS